MENRRQRQIIELDSPAALVLAGPGCGKTHILARRVLHAVSQGRAQFDDMLCLTFTNRAAREMSQRLEDLVGGVPSGLYMGNLHRFCLRFLFANQLVDPDTTVMDDEDFTRFACENLSPAYRDKAQRLKNTDTIVYQHEKGHSTDIRMHTSFNLGDMDLVMLPLYRQFKHDFKLIDYDDIILLAYEALSKYDAKGMAMTGYNWIQVDEVQDLTGIQLAIVELLKGDNASVLYLGDEQQAIFGFAGAGGRALEQLKIRCRGHIYHLDTNYRSPKELVSLCNDYAFNYLGLDRQRLPESASGNGGEGTLTLFRNYGDRLRDVVTALCARYLERFPDESAAVLVRSNYEGARLSETLEQNGVPHILLSSADLFRGVAFRTLWSHLAVVHNPIRRGEWARLMYQTGATDTLTTARLLVSRMTDIGVSPVQLLALDGSTEVERFVCLWNDYDTTVAVLDTETTGLDTDTDDIVQFAAVKYRGGERIAGSEISLFIESDKDLPAITGGVANPLLETYRQAKKTDAETAFEIIRNYLDGCVLAGHNICFDTSMLSRNYTRRCGSDVSWLENARTIDSLMLSRLLYPRLWRHTLGHMLGYMGLPGVNSHDATDDTDAAATLLNALFPIARRAMQHHSELRNDPQVRKTAQHFSETYGALYARSRAMLSSDSLSVDNSLSGFMWNSYCGLQTIGAIDKIDHFDYVLDLVDRLIVDKKREPRLHQQLGAHLHELMSFNEGDLFSQGIVRERLCVLTVHKAKGLEMDNVVCYDPTSYFGNREERMRLLYVAMSRARRRLAIACSDNPAKCLGELTRRFEWLSNSEQNILLMNAKGYGGQCDARTH